jgi:transcriptional regulator with XRE-family HTH domain
LRVDVVGERLRARRHELNRTLASIAIEAGLSVPYVANLERGRGNPTLSVLEALAEALGVPLVALLDEAAPKDANDAKAAPPPGLGAFAGSERFRREVRLLAADTGLPPADVRARLLGTLAAIADAAPRSLRERDWHRALDTLVLTYRK